jgi:hypothetical protein
MKKLFRLFFAISVLFVCAINVQNASAQKKNDNGNSAVKDSVRKAETLNFYGLDCSHLRISDELKISRSEGYSKVYPQAWINYIKKVIVRNYYVQRTLRKKHLYYHQDEILNVSLKVVPDFIISKDYSFPLDTVKIAVKSYSLQEKSGIGLVIIPENFNKRNERAYTWIVFFDIQTREVLWASNVSGFCRHMGYTNHWGSGIVEGFKAFVREDYRKHRFHGFD